jgi:hypothetical protein
VITDVPETDPAVTMPVSDPTVAIVLLLLHVPPAGASVNAVDDPVHIAVTPTIADGNGLTVKFVVILQPVSDV